MSTNSGRHDPDISHEFANHPDAPRAARHALRPLFPDDGAIADDVTLVASELVTNVVEHTDAGGLMEAWSDDPFVLNVTDFGRALPSPQAEADEHGGRGLRIIDDLADDWGTTPHAHGKTVWATFDRERVDPAD